MRSPLIEGTAGRLERLRDGRSMRGVAAAIMTCFRFEVGAEMGFCGGGDLASATPAFPPEFRTALIPRSFGNGWYDSPPGPSAPPFTSGSPLPPSRPYG